MDTGQKEENKKSSLPIGMPPGLPIGNLKTFKQLSEMKDNAKDMAQDFIKDKAKMIAKQAAKKAAAAALKNPYVLAAIGIGVAILIIFLIIIAVVTNQTGSSTSSSPAIVYKFVALGDSLTAWPNQSTSPYVVGSSIDGVGTPWPSQLAAEDQSFSLVKNAGVPAETTTQILARFNSDVAAYNPDVLFILGGTNDTDKSIDTIGNIKQIIIDAQKAGIKKIILLTIPHQCPTGSFTALNNQIKGLASASSNISVIDVSDVVPCGADYQADGVHFTNTGAKAVADYIDKQVYAQGIIPAPTAAPGPAPTQVGKVIYCQWSGSQSLGGGPWYTHPFVQNTIANAGCGPTSMAMIVSSFGHNITPDQVGDVFEKIGMAGCSSYGCGTNFWPGDNQTATNAWLQSFSLKATDVNLESSGSLNITAISKFLYPGSPYLLWGIIDNYQASSNPDAHGKHVVVIANINTGNQTLTLYNPEYCTSGEHAETISYVDNIGYKSHPGDSPYIWDQVIPISPTGVSQ
jgi:lysophospholipase L1-like esterase